MTIAARVRAPLAAAAVSLAVGLLILAVMLWKAEMLVRFGLVGHLWYILLLVMGLAAAICLFALFKSYAQYSGKVMNGNLMLGGPAVVMLIVILLGFGVVPKPSAKFNLTVFLQDQAGQGTLVLRNRGTLFLDIDAERRQEAVGNKGEVRFMGIPADQRGKKLPAFLDVDGYELEAASVDVPQDSEVIYVKVRAKPKQLNGGVFNVNGQPLPGAQLSLLDRTAVSDMHGRFVMSLPNDLPEDGRTLTIIAAGYVPWRGQVTPGGNPLVVQLSKLEKPL